MNTYRTSEGERLTRGQVESRMRLAKQAVINEQLLTHGYNFCVECKRSSGVRLDCAHVVSVDRCLKTGRAELAYDSKNIRMLCRDCHEDYDKLNIQCAS